MHEALTPGPFPSWDDFRFFLATSKAGSFSKAANRLGVTQPTISRRIESLEQRLAVRLFDRLPSGVALTSEGENVLEAARHIEQAVLEIQRSVVGSDKRLEGPVRISVTDGTAAYWLTPRLGQLQEKHPGISIELICSIEPADVLNMESDLSIRFRRPEEPELIAVRLGTMHFVPWASAGYLARFGMPASPEELLHHRLLDHAAYSDDDGDWSQWLALARAANLIGYRTNSSAAMLSAIQNGLGIGLLPTQTCEIGADIVPLDLGLRTYSHIWLTYHPSLRSAARIRAVIDWLKSLFDPAVWPWFGDEFHPPGDTRRQ
jgi:DNA-binding transcriptional LysR family regulator